MVTRRWFALFVVLLGLQRLAEVAWSRRNERRLLAWGGVELAAGQMPVMKALHAAWLAAMLAEVFALRRRFRPPLALPAAAVFALGQSLRYAAITTLGERWTVKVIALPGASVVRHGIYRRLRHPNYLGVILEMAAAPLLHGAVWTAAVFSLLNALLLRSRIRAEEQALSRFNDYSTAFADRRRFFPRLDE